MSQTAQKPQFDNIQLDSNSDLRIFYIVSAFKPFLSNLSLIPILFLLTSKWCCATQRKSQSNRKTILQTTAMEVCLYEIATLNPICPGWATYLQIHIWAHRKTFTFPNYKFGKGQYAFCRVKLSRFAENNKVCRIYPNFIMGDPYELGWRPLKSMKSHKSPSFTGGVLDIQASWILLNMVNHS